MLVVNLFAGPGTGKSTFATRLFSELKVADINSEYVSEYAKSVVWSGDLAKLSDQLYITAKQHQQLFRLNGKVDVAVSDSPLLLGVHYATPYYLGGTYTAMVRELFNQYDNLNIRLIRKKPYRAAGRLQTEEEARGIDRAVQIMLETENIPHITLDGTMDSIPEAIQIIKAALSSRNGSVSTSTYTA